MVSLNKSRERYGGTHLAHELLKEPSGLYENFCRMSLQDFELLLCKVGPHIAKKDTKWRKAIPARERLQVTLRFLATGDSYKSLHYLFKISPQTISTIIPEVCSALIIALQDCIQIPTTEVEWQKIAEDFEEKCNFSHCIRALDGKHVMIQAPMNSGSEFYNYKSFFSIVLMALVDANYCFTFVDCGCQGRLSDGAVFRNTELYKRIESNQLSFPCAEPLKGSARELPYVIVADDAFALSDKIMKPYPGMYNKGTKERVFNYRLSRARRVVENVFGIMTSVFRVLRKPLLVQPKTASLIAMTCAMLHNFLHKSRSSKSNYSPPGTFDSVNDNGDVIPGAWRRSEEHMSSMLSLAKIPRKASNDAKAVRNQFAEYFVAEGKLTWQDQYC